MKLRADWNTLEITENERLTSGSVGVYHASFAFASGWEGLDCTAVFRAANNYTLVHLDEGGVCTIPHESLRKPGELEISVFGTRGGEIVLTTNYANAGRIIKGADRTGAPGLDPEPSVYEEFLETVKTLRADVDGLEGGVSANEDRRVTAEAGRVEAEAGRVSNEIGRVTAEEEREAAERRRADETSGIVKRATDKAELAEAAMLAAEDARTKTETSEANSRKSEEEAGKSKQAAQDAAATATTKAGEAAASAASIQGIEAKVKESEAATLENAEAAARDAGVAKAEAERAAASAGSIQRGVAGGVAPLDDTGRVPVDNCPHPAQLGGIPIAKTYTPEGGTDGVDYAVDIPGLPTKDTGAALMSIPNGVPIIIIPHKTSTTKTAKLSLNGIIPKIIKRQSLGSSNGTTVGPSDDWIKAGAAMLLIWRGKNALNMWWTALSAPKPLALDIDGLPEGAYIVGGADSPVTKTPAEVLAHIGAASTEYVDSKMLVFREIIVPYYDWASDETYYGAGYKYRAALPCAGVTASHRPDVAFGVEDTAGGNFAPIAESYDGGVYIYAKDVPYANSEPLNIVIPSIVCIKGV